MNEVRTKYCLKFSNRYLKFEWQVSIYTLPWFSFFFRFPKKIPHRTANPANEEENRSVPRNGEDPKPNQFKYPSTGVSIIKTIYNFPEIVSPFFFSQPKNFSHNKFFVFPISMGRKKIRNQKKKIQTKKMSLIFVEINKHKRWTLTSSAAQRIWFHQNMIFYSPC